MLSGEKIVIAEEVTFHDSDAAIEYCYSNGWTDGMPFILPTRDRVDAMLAAIGGDPGAVIGVVPPRGGVATVEALATNAVMAGCRPSYFPVVAAALEAMLEPRFNLNGVQATTHMSAPLTIVAGPIVEKEEFNSGLGVFGSGYRANAAVARALRLILHNLGGGSPKQLDRATFGQPGKYGYCIAESATDNPWEPLHTALDPSLNADDSAVTVFACEPPHNIVDTHNDTPEGLLHVIAGSMTTLGNSNLRKGGESLVVVGPERARVFRDRKWSRADVCEYLYEHATVTVGQIMEAKVPRRTPHSVNWDDPKARVPMFEAPSDIHVTVAGGPGPHSVWCPGWGSNGGLAVARSL